MIVINIIIVDHRSHLSQSPVRQTMSSFPMLVTCLMIMMMIMMIIMMMVRWPTPRRPTTTLSCRAPHSRPGRRPSAGSTSGTSATSWASLTRPVPTTTSAATTAASTAVSTSTSRKMSSFARRRLSWVEEGFSRVWSPAKCWRKNTFIRFVAFYIFIS